VFHTDVLDVQVAGDTRYACAVRHDGSVWCWGDDYQGRIGALQGTGLSGAGEDGFDHPTPVQVHVEVAVDAGADAGDIGLGAPLGGVMAVQIGGAASCALEFDGTVWCWGSDSLAGLSDVGPYVAVQHPGARQALGLPANIARLDHHWASSFAVDGAGAVFAWGDDTFDELASTASEVACDLDNAAVARCSSPAVTVPALAGATSISTGQYTGVMVAAQSTVLAWGANDHAQLGHAPGTQGDGVCVCQGLAATMPCNAIPSPVLFP
jgi:alpha-tubulin suppressor-like RCC1 family protein